MNVLESRDFSSSHKKPRLALALRVFAFGFLFMYVREALWLFHFSVHFP